MTKKDGCKVRECISNHRREIVGAFFLLIATLLTILTFSGIGIFGMFLTGLCLCCHKHMCCRHCCHENGDEKSSSTAAKKTTTRKTTAKTAK